MNKFRRFANKINNWIFEENSLISKLMLMLGIILTTVSILAYSKYGFNSSITTSFGLGLLFIILFMYKINESSLAIPYFLASLFAIIGICAVIFPENYTLININIENIEWVFIPAIPIYLSLLFYRIIAWFHSNKIDDIEEEIERLNKRISNFQENKQDEIAEAKHKIKHHEKGFVISLDALITVASILIFYIGVTQTFNGGSSFTLSKTWQEGFCTSIGFLLTSLYQEKKIYYKSWGNKINYSILILSGLFLIIFSVTKAIFNPLQTNPVNLIISMLFGSLFGVILIYLSARTYKRQYKYHHE